MATLVIGIGNRHRRDDAVGCIAAARLNDLADTEVRVVSCDGAAGTLFEVWSAADRVFIIDAAWSAAAPGTIQRFDAAASPLPAVLCRAHSSHGFGLAESIELARVLGRLPALLVVYTIVGRDFGPGTDLTPAVARAADIVAGQIRREILAVSDVDSLPDRDGEPSGLC